MDARRLEEERMNEEIPPQVEQVEQVPHDGEGVQGAHGCQVPIVGECNEVLPEMHIRDIRVVLHALDRAVITQANLSMVRRVNVVEITMKSRLTDFVRMNPPIFLGSMVGEDPQDFLDRVYKVFSPMRVTSREKVEMASYQLRDASQIWYSQWKDNRPEESDPMEREKIK
ncbi:hypothetical protein EJD97_023781 [Solanum chilense]|uniref:Retrotransposon gag domain-containing protein n=1 Tax=Solanum chilense TaxID=4083 RepID=A0A6N2CA13_SOLCI|nr:hypothetical protein EJD97_023781 [Solanum chilense]